MHQLSSDHVIRNVVVDARVLFDVPAEQKPTENQKKLVVKLGVDYRAMIQKQPSRMRETNSAAM